MWGKEKKMCLKLPRNAPFENPTCPQVVKRNCSLEYPHGFKIDLLEV